jgi:hypothetical protein
LSGKQGPATSNEEAGFSIVEFVFDPWESSESGITFLSNASRKAPWQAMKKGRPAGSRPLLSKM